MKDVEDQCIPPTQKIKSNICAVARSLHTFQLCSNILYFAVKSLQFCYSYKVNT